jgi:hypothetical protein
MQKDYRPCLEKLAGAPPKRKAALIRSLLPGIEAALHSGQSLKDIWEALGNEGLQMTWLADDLSRFSHDCLAREKN